MKTPDVDRIRSEESRSLSEFLALYNENLPDAFPRATRESLETYRAAHPEYFKKQDIWSLDLHRKKVMDWLALSAPMRAL